MAASDLVVNISGNAQSLKKTLGGAAGGIRGFGKIAKGVTAGLKLSFAGMAAAVAPLMLAFKGFSMLGEASDLAKTQIAAEKKLAAVLKSTGHAAGVSAAEIGKLASSRQAITNFGDEATLAATGILATFKEIKGDNFKQTIPLMQDMASVMEGDLKSSALMLGKALNDPVAGMGAMSRAGVQFSHDQKQVIKGLVETGQLAKAQALMMGELKSQFGGAAEAMADPLTQAANAWGDAKEQIGMIWNDIKVAALEAFGFDEAMAAAGDMAKNFRKEWLPSIKGVLTGVADIFKQVVAFLQEQWSTWGKEAVKEIAFIGENFQLFFNVAKEYLGLWVKNGLTIVGNFFDNFSGWMDWLENNWLKLWMDLQKLQFTAMTNMAKNTGSLLKSAWKYGSGGGWEKPVFHKLSEGFKSTVEPFSDHLKQGLMKGVEETTPELKKLMQQVGAARKEFDTRFQLPGELAVDNLPDFSAKNTGPSGGGGVNRKDFAAANSSIEVGTREAFTKIFAALGGNEKKKPENKTADNTAQTVDLLAEVKKIWERVERKLGIEKVVDLIG